MNIYKIQYYLLKSKYWQERFAFSQSVLFILSFHNSKKKDPRQKRLWKYFFPPPLCQVANPGQALQTLGSAFLNIMWPYELANEKWLLYPASLTFQGHPETQCSPTSALNPLKLQGSSPAEPGSHGVGGASHCRLWTGSFVYTYTQKYICWLKLIWVHVNFSWYIFTYSITFNGIWSNERYFIGIHFFVLVMFPWINNNK